MWFYLDIIYFNFLLNILFIFHSFFFFLNKHTHTHTHTHTNTQERENNVLTQRSHHKFHSKGMVANFKGGSKK